ncbi:hypothetical protein BDP27DRAFT_1320287 [Rhodocollybia butyracea]|uniref:Uncharacterized protein n=1 Tax=Rhodocollybia butyracea TaxID=206335 RepID=A0A9P5UB18_9AGAR|nr:hypothetical protein BDP27DRAFT_1320287 [Rhodocollybia butyracea]
MVGVSEQLIIMVLLQYFSSRRCKALLTAYFYFCIFLSSMNTLIHYTTTFGSHGLP